MNMRHLMLFLVSFSISFGVSQMIAHSAEANKKAKEPDMVCVSNAELDKIMVEKGYDVILTMKNPDNVVESVWAGGQQIVITAAVPDQPNSCILATMTNVTYNPKAIEEIWETYKKQTKQKDI